MVLQKLHLSEVDMNSFCQILHLISRNSTVPCKETRIFSILLLHLAKNHAKSIEPTFQTFEPQKIKDSKENYSQLHMPLQQV